MKKSLAFLSFLIYAAAPADSFHYKDIIVGERAIGLGGAFTAISDDPSGILYNPAGIAFSSENYLSVSTNAYTTNNETFTNIEGAGQNYSTRSQSLLPSMVGVTQTLGPGKLGIGLFSTNSEAIDQADRLELPSDIPEKNRIITRHVLSQNNTYLVGPAYAIELFSNLSIGVSVLGKFSVFKSIDNLNQLTPAKDGADYNYELRSEDKRSTEFGLLPILGIQFMPIAKWSLGLAISRPFVQGRSKTTRLKTHLTNADPPQIPEPTGKFNPDFEESVVTNTYSIGSPFQTSISSAYFVNRAFLIAAQADIFQDLIYNKVNAALTLNWTLAAEYFPMDWLALRGAIYSNNASTPVPRVNATPELQPAHIDQLGGAFGLSVYRPSSSITLSATYSQGTGKGQATEKQNEFTPMDRSVLTLYLSGSYQL